MPTVTSAVQEWYSGMLIQHGADVIDAILPVAKASNGSGPTVSPYKRCSHNWTAKMVLSLRALITKPTLSIARGCTQD